MRTPAASLVLTLALVACGGGSATPDAQPSSGDAAEAAADAEVVVLADAAVELAFESDFEDTLPPEVTTETCTLTPSQGFATLGPVGNQFGATFLRCGTGSAVALQTDLPDHTTISLAFLFAAIDSLDGTGTFPAGDFMRITLDGEEIFRESFANATPDQIQSYVAPAGVELARRIDLGFQGPGSFYTDSAYDMGADPRFQDLPHTASSALIEFTLEGEGVQPLDDESWAFDNLRLTLGD